MRALIVPVFLSISMLSFDVCAAAEPTSNIIALISKDGKRFPVQKDIATLAKTIKSMVEDLPKETGYQVGDISGKTLKEILIPLMQLAFDIQHKPSIERLNTLTSRMKDLLKRNDLEAWQNLLNDINYLDIEVLKKPLANGMIQKIYQMQKGQDKQIEKMVLDLHIPNEFKSLLAKYWYLNYGSLQAFILNRIDYGFSVEELVAYKKLKEIDTTYWEFPFSRINDLTGLQAIPHVADITRLDLAVNHIEELPHGIFNGFNKLEILILRGNRIKELPQGIFNDLTNLELLDISGNQLTPESKQELRQQLGNRVKL